MSKLNRSKLNIINDRNIYEALRVKRQVARKVYVNYLRTGVPGARSESDRKIDKLINSVMQNFDLSLVFSGSHILAQRSAEDLVKEITAKAKKELPNEDLKDIMRRWRTLVNFWRKSASAFINKLKRSAVA